MFNSGIEHPMIAKNPFPSPDSTCPSDSENEVMQELEFKRRSINEEISQFRTSKEKEFRDFEQALRTKRRQKRQNAPNQRIGHETEATSGKPKRTSSSSALDLLVGHGISQTSPTSALSSRPNRGAVHRKKNSFTTKTGPLPSRPTLSVDPLNINGETIAQSQSKPPATPTLLSRNVSQTSLNSPKVDNSLPEVALQESSTQQESKVNSSTEKYDSFVGVLTPSYLPLLDSDSGRQISSQSPLVTPPADEADDESSHGLVTLPNGVLPLQSSSFPPHVAILSPATSATKRAYTAPAAIRKPSALRSASAGNLARKRKHVTFRLADMAIVDPSSSYEEGPSPIEDGQPHARSKSTTAVSHSSRKSSSLRYSNTSPRNGLINDHARSDEEDEAAGVKPGMSMDEVMQKLNAHLVYEDDEDVGWTDTKYHEDDDDDDELDHQSGRHNAVNLQDHFDEDDEDDDDEEEEEEDTDDAEDEQDRLAQEATESYFSPKSHELYNMPHRPFSVGTDADSRRHRDRSGSSPLTPLRDRNWDDLSSSDKDRLLFSDRTSDSDDERYQHSSQIAHNKNKSQGERATALNSGLSGLKMTGSTNSLSSLASLKKNHPVSSNPSEQRKSTITKSLRQTTNVPKFNDNLGPSADGGSGIGFFELDEELASPHAGKARPFDVDTDHDTEAEQEDIEFDDSTTKPVRSSGTESMKSAILGTGIASVPINIVRPSTSVSSSWVGTFGH